VSVIAVESGLGAPPDEAGFLLAELPEDQWMFQVLLATTCK
jgi:hypothetical protein